MGGAVGLSALGTAVATAGVQAMLADDGLVILQLMVPAGWTPPLPVRSTVTVVVPPRVAALWLIAPMVGTRVEIPRVTLLLAALV